MRSKLGMGQEGRWTPPVGAASVQWVVGSEVRGDANASVGPPGPPYSRPGVESQIGLDRKYISL